MSKPEQEFETVYSPSGELVKATRLNAMDLVRHSGYSWRRDAAPVAANVSEESVKTYPEAEPEAITEEDVVSLDVKTADLTDIAEVIADTDQLTYLSSFSVEKLKDMAEERYGEKLRSNISKDKAIEKIMSLESERISSETAYE
jgi:hypothetical protein